MQKMIKKLLHNKLVLYATVIFTMVNIFGYMMTGCTYTVAFFALTAFVNSMFTKNMILILGGSLFLTNTFMVCKVIKEGFSFSSTEGFEGKKKEGLKIDTPLGSLSTGKDDKDDDKKDDKSDSDSKMTEKDCKKKKDHEWKDDKCVKKESMTTAYKKNDSYVDHAATVNEAYGDLEGLLGKEGIEGLTKDTEALVGQQKKMMEMMDNMGPMVEQVKGMMDSMGGSDGMTKMLSGFSNPKK